MRIIKLSLVIAAAATLLYTVIINLISKKEASFNVHYIARVKSDDKNTNANIDKIFTILMKRVEKISKGYPFFIWVY